MNLTSRIYPGWFSSIGRVLFAIGFIGMAIIGFNVQDFLVGRPPAWPSVSMPPGWIIHFSNGVLLIAAILILFRRMIEAAGLAMALLILFLSLSRHFPVFLRDWTNGYKALAFFGSSFIVAFQLQWASYSLAQARNIPSLKSDLMKFGILLLAIFFLACGYAHFKFADFVVHFIPDYIPFRSFWAYFCGICLIAAGIGLLVPSARQIAAFLCGMMILSWFFLVHIPRIFCYPGTTAEFMGLFESLAFSGILLVLSGVPPGGSR